MIRALSRLLAAGFLLVPLLAFGQAAAHEHQPWIERVEDAAPGTAFFVIAIAIIATVFGILREKFRRDLFARFIDKGQEIPPALLPLPPSRLRELRRGVRLIGLGLGVGIALYLASGSLRVAAWSLILLFLGAASFVNATLFYSNPKDPTGRVTAAEE